MSRRDQQRRMAYLGTLAGGLAHEIRNPLSTMKVNLQLLRDDLERDSKAAIDRSRRRVDVLHGYAASPVEWPVELPEIAIVLLDSDHVAGPAKGVPFPVPDRDL